MTGKIRVLDYSLENTASLRVRERKRERERNYVASCRTFFRSNI